MGAKKPAAQKREPERIARLLEALEVGASRNDAARSVGLAKSTIPTWMKRREKDKELRELCDQIEAAESRCVVNLLRSVHEGAVKAPAAAMTLLAKKRPEEFGRKVDEPATAGPVTVQALVQVIQKIGEGHGGDSDTEFLVRAAGLEHTNGSAGSLGQVPPPEAPANGTGGVPG